MAARWGAAYCVLAILASGVGAQQDAGHIARLVAALGDETTREHAARELMAVGRPALKELMTVVRRLADPEPPVRPPESFRVELQALDIIGRMGASAVSALPELEQVVRKTPWRVRGNVVRAIADLWPHATELRGDKARYMAATAARRSTDPGGLFCVVLEEGKYLVVPSGDGFRARYRLSAFPEWRAAPPVGALIATLEAGSTRSSQPARELAAEMLQRRGAAASDAVRPLENLLREHYPREATPEAWAFRQALNRRNPRYLSGLADALITLDAAAATLGWIHRLSAGTRAERVEAAHALGRLGPRASDAVAYLITSSRSGVGAVAAEAVVALGRIGARAATAVPLLEDLTRRGDAKLRTLAKASLEQIRGR